MGLIDDYSSGLTYFCTIKHKINKDKTHKIVFMFSPQEQIGYIFVADLKNLIAVSPNYLYMLNKINWSPGNVGHISAIPLNTSLGPPIANKPFISFLNDAKEIAENNGTLLKIPIVIVSETDSISSAKEFFKKHYNLDYAPTPEELEKLIRLGHVKIK